MIDTYSHNTPEGGEALVPIGLLRGRVAKRDLFNRDQYSTSLFYIAPQYGLQIVLFTEGDVDFETNTLRGIILRNGKPEQCTIPIPGVVDNFNFFGKVFFDKLNESTYLTRDWIGRDSKTKNKDYEELLEDGRFADILIPTHEVSSIDEVFEELDKRPIVLKPARGTEGELVVCITKDSTGYQMVEGINNFHLTRDEFIEFYEINVASKPFKFVMQPFIKSITKYGEPCDIRVSCRRGPEGKFVVTHYARVGNPEGIVSNYATGGHTLPIHFFLRKYFDEKTQKEIQSKLDKLGEEFPEHYIKTIYNGMKLYDVGLDLGITNESGKIKLWLFEVNSRGLGGSIYGLSEQTAQCSYYKHLADNLGLKPSVIKAVKFNCNWPVTPKYKPTIHDYYHSNDGHERVEYLTHNNGLMQFKNYSTMTPVNFRGFNITTSPGTPVAAIADGRIVAVQSGFDDDGAEIAQWGNFITIRHFATHMNKPVYSLYGHLSNCQVNVGDVIKSGEIIGLSGNSGGSRIPSLHLAIRVGENTQASAVDPLELLPECDFDSLSDELSSDDGFSKSSIELYKSVLEYGWDYHVKVKTTVDKTFKFGRGLKLVPKGSELELVKRGKDVAVVLVGKRRCSYRADDLLYTY